MVSWPHFGMLCKTCDTQVLLNADEFLAFMLYAQNISSGRSVRVDGSEPAPWPLVVRWFTDLAPPGEGAHWSGIHPCQRRLSEPPLSFSTDRQTSYARRAAWEVRTVDLCVGPHSH